MGDCCIDVVCTLVNTIVAQVVAFKDLEADARELHRHLGSLRGLLESMQLTPDGERALKTPEANRAMLDIADSLRDYKNLITKMQDMKKCTRFLRARDLLDAIRSAGRVLERKLTMLQTAISVQIAGSQEHLLRQFEATREGMRLMRLELLQSYYAGAAQLQGRVEELLLGPGGAGARAEAAVKEAVREALQRHGAGLDEADVEGWRAALAELRGQVSELRAAKEAQEALYLDQIVAALSGGDLRGAAQQQGQGQQSRPLEVPSYFCCPITRQIMRDPVTLEAHTFERAAIQQHLRRHNTNPMTNAPLRNREVHPNLAVRESIAGWLQERNLTFEDVERGEEEQAAAAAAAALAANSRSCSPSTTTTTNTTAASCSNSAPVSAFLAAASTSTLATPALDCCGPSKTNHNSSIVTGNTPTTAGVSSSLPAPLSGASDSLGSTIFGQPYYPSMSALPDGQATVSDNATTSVIGVHGASSSCGDLPAFGSAASGAGGLLAGAPHGTCSGLPSGSVMPGAAAAQGCEAEQQGRGLVSHAPTGTLSDDEEEEAEGEASLGPAAEALGQVVVPVDQAAGDAKEGLELPAAASARAPQLAVTPEERQLLNECKSKVPDIVAIAELLNKGTNVNVTDNDWYTCLHSAALYGHTLVVRLLLALGADVDPRTTSLSTPLHLASLRGHADACLLLLGAGAEPGARDGEGKSALDLARDKGHAAVEEILGGRTERVMRAAGCVASDGRAPPRLPLARTADEVLLLSACKRGDLDALLGLVDSGTAVNVVDETAMTPLHWCAEYGQGVLAAVLLKAGADPYAQTRGGLTPLHCAASPSWGSGPGHLVVARALLAAGADPGLKDADGKTARDLAKKKRREDISALLKQHQGEEGSKSLSLGGGSFVTALQRGWRKASLRSSLKASTDGGAQ